MLPGLRPPTLTPERGNPPPRAADGFQIAGGMRGEPAGSFSPLPGPFPPPDGVNRDGTARGALRVRPPETCRLSCAHPRRSGRVAEGGALLRRYGGECLHRGFESLLLRFWTIVVSIPAAAERGGDRSHTPPFM